MTNTTNRNVINVNKPSVKNQYFNHVNWKGLCEHKNYFNVDQETFEDCSNVYMDEEAILKSRPPVIDAEDIGLHNNIRDVWSIGKYTIYLQNTGFLSVQLKWSFVKDNKIVLTTEQVSRNSIPFLFNNKICWFYKNADNIVSFMAFDLTNETVYVNNDDILVPTTKVITDGISTDNIATNILTDDTNSRYIYTDKQYNMPFNIGDKIKITVNNESITTDYTNDIANRILFKKYNLTDDNYFSNNTLLLSKYDNKYREQLRPLISVSDNDIIIISKIVSFSNVDGGDEEMRGRIYDIQYSVDGRTFVTLPRCPYNVYGEPKISKDGTYVAVLTKTGPYAYSLLEDNVNGTKAFPIWTNLNEYNNIMASKDIPNIEDLRTSDGTYFTNDAVGSCFVDYKNYTYCFATNNGSSDNAKLFSGITRVVCYNSDLQHNTLTAMKDTLYLPPSTLEQNQLFVENLFINVDYTVDSSRAFAAYSFSAYCHNNPTNKKCKGAILVSTVFVNTSGSISISHGTLISIPVYIPNGDERIKSIYSPEIKWVGQNLQIILQGSMTGAGAIIPDATDTTIFSIVRILMFNSGATPQSYLVSWDKRTSLDSSTKFYYDNIINTKYNDTDFIPSISTQQAVQKDGAVTSSSNNIYVLINNCLYSTKMLRGDTYYIDTHTNSTILNDFEFEKFAKLSNLFFAKNNKLYITENVYDDDGNLKLYIPSDIIETFSEKITNLYPLSNNQLGIFFENSVYYTNVTDVGITYTKSKLQIGCKDGADVISSYDGKNIIFSTVNGLVYMSYQDFVQSTDQVLTFLSDTIFNKYTNFNSKPVKLYLYKYWIFCYHTDDKDILVFDVRNKSWWPWKFLFGLQKIYTNSSLEFFNNSVTKRQVLLEKYTDTYKDKKKDIEYNIDWYFKSQKLHLGTLNYYKNIISIMINNVQSTIIEYPVSFNLYITNYRTTISNRYDAPQTVEYDVELVRSYVKRCNSRKVNEFQYTISNDSDNVIQYPLSINSIVIKYNISGQVR